MKKPVSFQPLYWKEKPRESEINRIDDPRVKIQASLWNPVSGLMDPIVIRQFDGMSTMTPYSIPDTQGTYSQNFTTTAYPSHQVRPGLTWLGTRPGTTRAQALFVRGGSEFHLVDNGGTWWKYTAGGWGSLRTGFQPDRVWSFINFQGNFTSNNIIATDGTTVYKCDGSTVQNLANAPSSCDYVETHDNRVYLSQGQTLYFSALRKADDWTTVNDSGSIIVETSDAYPITGLIAGSARLTVFKKNSIHELFGTNPSNFQMTTVTENIGCPTGNTAQVIEGVIYFLGNDAVYRYSGGSLPSSVFSEPIKKTLKTINKNYSYKSISWNDGRKYYLGFPTGSNNYPDTFLEYDTMYGTWNTWTFNYPPTTSGVLYDGNVYLGHLNSGIVKLDPTAQMDTIFLGNFGISYEWTSKPFTFSSMAAKTRWFKLWLSANVPNGTTLTVSLASDQSGGAFNSVFTFTGTDSTTQVKEIIIPIDQVNNAKEVQVKLTGTGPFTLYELSRQERVFPLGQR